MVIAQSATVAAMAALFTFDVLRHDALAASIAAFGLAMTVLLWVATRLKQ